MAMRLDLIEGAEDEIFETNAPWKIETDEDAEWLIETINNKLYEINRYEISLLNKIEAVKKKIEILKEEKQRAIAKRDFYLGEYFETLPDMAKKISKTQEKYRLPSGSIIKKYPQPEYKRDETKLLEWTKANKLNDYIEVKESVKWGELKKITATSGKNIIIEETGEIVEGVEAVERPPVIEFKED